MKLQQLRYFVEIVRQNLNLSQAAEMLHTSQPGVSKQIQLFEEELGAALFVRHGKRLVALTPLGQQILPFAHHMLQTSANIKSATQEILDESQGSLTIATTHTQARYVLPPVILTFRARYPNVRLNIKQGSPMQIAEMVATGIADIAIATEGLEHFSNLLMLPCYEWNRALIVPKNHPLTQQAKLTLQQIADYPLLTYDFAFTGRSKMNQAFQAQQLTPNIVFTAIDSDVIKKYVTLGLGLGIIASMAFEPERDSELQAIDVAHLFAASTTSIGLRKNVYLRQYLYFFIHLFAPQLTPSVVNQALHIHE